MCTFTSIVLRYQPLHLHLYACILKLQYIFVFGMMHILWHTHMADTNFYLKVIFL